MKVENGRMVYEPRACYSCEGKGSRDYYVLCPRRGQANNKEPGRVCSACGAKNKHDHRTVGTEHRQCESCQGEGWPMETAYDTVPKEILQELPVKIYRSNRHQTWIEANLGGGLVSITDYGDHKKLTDEQLIAKVREDFRGTQAISGIVSRADHGRMCVHIGVLTSDNGYTVIGVFEKVTA